MAERLVTLLATQWSGFDSRSRPDLRLEWKRWLFSVTLLEGHVASTSIEIIKWVKKFAVAKVC
jgi:hypothetical protein